MKNNKIEIILRRTEISDLDKLFQIQLDKDENDSAHKVKKLTDKTTYFTKCNKLLNDSTVNYQTITIDNIVVGSIAKFVRNREPEVTYIIDRKLWGQGIATKSLKQFLNNETTRPIYGRTAFDNFGSQKVLEKCGFTKIGTGKYFANDRQLEIDEFIYSLDN